jgi:hypothetical protein
MPRRGSRDHRWPRNHLRSTRRSLPLIFLRTLNRDADASSEGVGRFVAFRSPSSLLHTAQWPHASVTGIPSAHSPFARRNGRTPMPSSVHRDVCPKIGFEVLAILVDPPDKHSDSLACP